MNNLGTEKTKGFVIPNPESIRTAYPQASPQFPYNSLPLTREGSEPVYGIWAEPNQRVAVRDGVRLVLDVFRPAGRPGDTEAQEFSASNHRTFYNPKKSKGGW